QARYGSWSAAMRALLVPPPRPRGLSWGHPFRVGGEGEKLALPGRASRPQRLDGLAHAAVAAEKVVSDPHHQAIGMGMRAPRADEPGEFVFRVILVERTKRDEGGRR